MKSQKRQASLDCSNLTRGYLGVLESLKQGCFREMDFFFSFPSEERTLVLIEECIGANFPLCNFNVCFLCLKKEITSPYKVLLLD